MQSGRSSARFILLLITAVLGISGTAFYVFYIKNRAAGNEAGSRILELKDTVSGKIYNRWTLEEGSEFSMEFIHSVNMSPVRETFFVEADMIRLKSLRFYSYGAGIPSHLEESWALSRDGDAMLITGFNSLFKEINFMAGTVSEYLLFINGETLILGRDGNTRLTLSLK